MIETKVTCDYCRNEILPKDSVFKVSVWSTQDPYTLADFHSCCAASILNSYFSTHSIEDWRKEWSGNGG